MPPLRERRGRLRLARLTAEHGADAALPTLRHELAGDPSRRYVRDAARVEADAAYAQGWPAGYNACKRRQDNARDLL